MNRIGHLVIILHQSSFGFNDWIEIQNTQTGLCFPLGMDDIWLNLMKLSCASLLDSEKYLEGLREDANYLLDHIEELKGIVVKHFL